MVRLRRIRRNPFRLSLLSKILILIFILWQLFNWYSISKTDPLEIIQWSGIPIYVPNIPKHIIQTSKSSSDVNIATNSFIRLNPTYQYIHYNDSIAENFVRRTMPDYIYQTYISLPEPVMKADYFRYIVLLVKGGIYTDMDTICLQPIDTWIKGMIMNRTGLIIGIEADASLWDVWQGDYARQIQFVQWTIAAAPGHPILYEIVKRIADISRTMIRDMTSEKQILEWTGPAVWTDVITNYISVKYGFSWRNFKNLNQPLLIGNDIYVLPITAFSPGLNRMGSKPITDPDAKVQHFFQGSWRKSNEKRSIKRKRSSH
ncbi:unnamed protein product [Adineta steineri]|uniref:Initiation-specific alpha-1,6-mannosyltransferase n=1 Tax=Adineta steineri TaxID=433720 RepID=A0A819L284_9BILA|nr:unnamed protein product [Adineta steineri]CAF3958936.1 unnamed protein product [Adineta steineri]